MIGYYKVEYISVMIKYSHEWHFRLKIIDCGSHVDHKELLRDYIVIYYLMLWTQILRSKHQRGIFVAW